ncbi:MAG TPA: ATP-binding protein, partial [Glaciihabitans sp.]|nr:ATP-binding protein [Glaciihabitans sp.]
IAVIRESLTNVVKHAQADETSVGVSVSDGVLTIEIIDDGVGVGDTTRRSGLANLTSRAIAHGGDFTFDSVPGRTCVRWSAPYKNTDEATSR